jgi:glutamine amidotransferase/cyclase
MPTVHLLDYVAGNVRSLVNAIEKVGYTVEWVKTPADVPSAEVRQNSTTTMHTSIDKC